MSDFSIPEIINVSFFDSRQKFNSIIKTPERKTDCYEIEFYTEDNGYAIINGEKTKMHKGDILISKPGYVRRSILPFKCYYIYFAANSGDICQKLQALPDHIKSIRYSEYEILFNEMINLKNTADKGELMLYSNALRLVTMLCYDYDLQRKMKKQNLNTDSTVIKKSIDFINQNFGDDITLSDIAAAVNLSPVYFHRIFKSIVGKTPQEYLVEKRIFEAEILLSTSAEPIYQIAEKCGFKSNSYFGKVFKAVENITPNEYRSTAVYKNDYLI